MTEHTQDDMNAMTPEQMAQFVQQLCATIAKAEKDNSTAVHRLLGDQTKAVNLPVEPAVAGSSIWGIAI